MSFNKKVSATPLAPNQKESSVDIAEQELQMEAFVQYRQFFGPGEFKFAIYPDFWKGKWGKPPLLGIVTADNEFLAERLAYDRGVISPFNCSFGFKFKNLGPNKREYRSGTLSTQSSS